MPGESDVALVANAILGLDELQTKTSGFLGAMMLCSSNENKGIQTRNIPPMFLRHPDWFENPSQLHKAVSRSHSPSGRSVLSSHHAQNKSQNP